MTDEPIKVLFPVEQDDSGYPPVSCEQIWCLPSGGDMYIIDNVPFYARDVSMGDEVRTETRDGERWFSSVVNPSRNTTVRAFARKKAFAPLLTPQLQSFGGMTEKMEGSDLVAASFPPGADLEGALEFLDQETQAGNVAFEESAVRYR